MSGLVNALVIAAVAALVISRQFRARRFDADRRWWLLPLILTVVALREPGLIDTRHRTESVALLAVELLVGLAIGAGWAWTSRIWVEADGAVWTKGTRAAAAVWVVGVAVRVGLFGVGRVLDVHQNSSALTLALGGTLLVRSGVLAWRAQTLAGAAVRAAAYGDGTPRSADDTARLAWKERV
ncbi:CcdC protein domain-containing protein [Streptomyces tropicalis]|uniref:DUF1453 family protein n=1 Tax=Streptomyces tropicalis TaxID=3034234 RepID=A0ABT6A119_9ACTN|nr:CcdC protein domain-containing protein [Streptomyces tropicalis]MDF3298335.1 DUF1453 family protein [Streptomyces tropicalis]